MADGESIPQIPESNGESNSDNHVVAAQDGVVEQGHTFTPAEVEAIERAARAEGQAEATQSAFDMLKDLVGGAQATTADVVRANADAEKARAEADARKAEADADARAKADQARAAADAARAKSTGSGTGAGKSAAEVQAEEAEKKKVKGRKEWERNNPFEDGFWQSTSYDRKKDDFTAANFEDQLDKEIKALQEVANELVADPNSLPIGAIKKLNTIEFDDGGTTRNVAIRLNRYADLVGSTGTVREKILALSYDLIDSLAQRAGEAQLLHVENPVQSSAGRLTDEEAESYWQTCTKHAATIGSEVLLAKGHKAREEFNTSNEHLDGTEEEVAIKEASYEEQAAMKMREAFDKQAAHALEEGFKFTSTYRDLHPKSESKADDKRRKAKTKAGKDPNEVGVPPLFPNEGVEKEGESYKWSKDHKVAHVGAAVATLATELYFRVSEMDLSRGFENTLAIIAGSYGLIKVGQAGVSERHKNKIEDTKRKEHLADQVSQTRAPKPLEGNPDEATAVEKMQVAYPDALKPFDQAGFERAHDATRNVRLVSALCAFAVAASLAVIGDESGDQAQPTFEADVPAGAPMDTEELEEELGEDFDAGDSAVSPEDFQDLSEQNQQGQALEEAAGAGGS
ncbi:TPA: hypothetical protein EYO12_03850 [Candidatus Saccharibacteria bacterium]|nr:hypothetical protein [Candidatus Saccharibacteria bacterium]HIO87827.1 hypothetical protein [Candidatus Saccharibacteria bacterium]